MMRKLLTKEQRAEALKTIAEVSKPGWAKRFFDECLAQIEQEQRKSQVRGEYARFLWLHSPLRRKLIQKSNSIH